MSTFRTAIRVLSRHWAYILIYLVMLSFMGSLIAVGNVEEGGSTVGGSTPTVAVIDRDGSDVSRGISAFVEGQGDVVRIDDTDAAIQDATATDMAQYILVIPAGYGDDLMAAAASGMDAPALETVVSYQSAAGSLMDVSVKEYLQAAYGFASTVSDDQGEVVRLAGDAMSATSTLSSVAQDATPVSSRFIIYAAFSTYPLFAAITVSIAVLMKVMNDRDKRQRMLAAPTRASARGVGMFGACCVVGLVSWVWICLLGLVLFGQGALRTSGVQVALICLSLLAYAAVAVAIGFLLGQLGISENAANAVANIGGMLMGVLGGAWIPLDLLPDAIVTLAHFLPSYWSITAVNDAAGMSMVSGTAVAGVLGEIGVAALFAVATFAVALAVGRARMREAS
ncbi:MAG: ABC transporter permease [Atopobiaceae bacterium]|jgi:ABC-2 type transport system permease protein|nr:ABC transporter permease [Atopobiaceae bacterium]MCI2172725.1 ABC transporter permease [Atopobiaceae bacterium]MCI2207032.1 ABC transporter permease [Atopobiaceae bacterium]